MVRPFFWTVAVLAVLISVAQLLLDTRGVRQWAAGTISERLGDYLDRPVAIADVSFELIPMTIEVWGLTIGGPPGCEEPFLEVPWAEIDADLEALRQKVIRLREIRVERPRIRVLYLPDGRHNILRLRRKRRGPPRFEVHIDRVAVDKAELLLDQESIRLSLTAEALRGRLLGRGDRHVAGQVVGQNVVVRLPNARPLQVAVSGQLSVERGRVGIETAKLSAPGFSATVDGSCGWPREAPQDKLCQLRVRGKTRGEVLAALGYFADLRGDLEFTGNVTWRPGSFGWRSRITAPEIELWDRRIEDLTGILAADRHGARFALEGASYGGGELDGAINYDIDLTAGRAAARRTMTVDLNFRDVTIDNLLADQRIPAGECAARLHGHVLYRFPMSRARRGSGHGEVEVTEDPALSGLPLSGAFPLRIADGLVRSESISLHSARQSALASGWYDLERERGLYEYEIASADLAQLAALLPFEQQEEPLLLWLPTAGEGEIAGSLHLQPGKLATDVRLRLTEVMTPSLGTPHRVTGGLHYSPELIEPLRLELGAGDEALMMHGRIPLAPGDPLGIVLTFDAFDWSMDQVHPWLPFELPLAGRISGRLDLHVDEESSDGQLRATVSPAIVSGIGLETMSGFVTWNDERLRVDDLELTAAAGRATGRGTLAWADQALDVDLRAQALELGAEPLVAYLPRPDITGRVAATAHFGGRLSRPRLRLDLAVDEIALSGRRLRARPSQLELRWADGRLEARGMLLDMVTLSGGGSLAGGRGDLTFDLNGTDVGGLLELHLAEPPAGIGGSFGGQLRIAGEEGGFPAIDLELDTLRIAYRDRLLGNREPVSARIAPDYLEIRSFYLEEEATGSDLFLSGRLGYEAEAPVDLRLQSTFEAGWLELWEPALRFAGSIDLLARVGGTVKRPYLDGVGEVREGRIAMASESSEFPHALNELRGIVLFYPDAVVIDHLEAALAGGRLAVEGRSAVPRPGEVLEYRLRLAGNDLRLRYPEGWLIHGDMELTLRSLESGCLLGGHAALRGIEYFEDIPVSFAEVMQGFFRRRRLEVSEADELLSTTQLNVELDAPQAVRVRNNLADLSGSAELLLRGTLAQPVLYGEVDIDPGGRLVYSSTEYEVDRGRFTFTDPRVPDPEIDMVATTRVRDFDVTLTLSGTMERLIARFSSEPPLPDLEVFQLLATGKAPESDRRAFERAAEPVGAESASAASFIYGQAAAVVGERVSDLFGLDKFRIEPLTDSGDNLSQTRVTVGKRLSKDLFVTYSADPSSTEEPRWQVEWQVGSGLVLVLTQNGDSTYSADARWETSF
ncbi:MAG: hypothetical protein GY856_52210 [bacterium]|nr:hypothetical protein [bacterium]